MLVASVAAQLLYHLVGAEIELVEVLALLLAHAPAGVAPDALQSRMQIADETDNFSLHKKYTPVVIFDPATMCFCCCQEFLCERVGGKGLIEKFPDVSEIRAVSGDSSNLPENMIFRLFYPARESFPGSDCQKLNEL